ncbi:M24 family metallopeptidase [Corynebacterium caspium]|uniref:M24 family metallopeptidase n=1 Tax=Corynebacterium caspium TaxID=234828 RepID=UPI0003642CB6|nr:Xaa-Pro peptidase family protein [Corynebacterium caspium]WKD59308.1 Xaa-Pro dipeptidase [Corynebacterium caspium DSM 44850]
MSTLFPISVYQQRLDKAVQLCRQKNLAGLIISTGAELAYLTGSWLSTHERLTALVVPAYGPALIVVPATDAQDLKLSAVPELPISVRPWSDGENPHELVATALRAGLTASQEMPSLIGLGESLTTNHVLRLQALLPEFEAVLAATALKDLFMRKDSAEIEELRQVAKAIDTVHAQVPALLQAGRTEAEVAADIEQLILIEHREVDFIIVGSGPNGANPHHSFSDRVLEDGDIVVVDIGGTYGVGYHSDCTRTYRVGGAPQPEEIPAAYRVLKEAQEAAVQAIRPGVKAAEIDAVARDILTAAGYGEQFFHRVGHGIGLSTHEEPFIMAGNELILEPGMAFSVEPGVYFEGKWGARIEDIVVVTTDGCERLNNNSRDIQ